MKSFLTKITLLIALTGAFLFPDLLLAQVSASIPGLSENAMRLVLYPQYPRPEETFTVSAVTGSSNFGEYGFTWLVDGKVYREGQNKKQIELVAPPLGKQIVIEVAAQTATGIKEATASLRPALVDIIWQARSSVHPFYKGKALLPPEGIVTLYAEPKFVLASGASVPISDLTFIWRKNTYIEEGFSGRGKNTYTMKAPVDTSLAREIEVEVSYGSQNLKAMATFFPTLTNPNVLFYQKTPLLGTLFNKTISSPYQMPVDEVTFVAIPYFFSSDKSLSNLTFNWSINGNPVNQTDYSPNLLTVRRPEGEGSSLISIDVKHPTGLLQKIFSSFTATYGNRENTF